MKFSPQLRSLANGKEQTLVQVAQHMGLSRERIRLS
ncbi:MAG: hypothetical protein KME29_20780 [Calothrix sp. FI2-JRJ7]|nr:hypothetical protein [Calothrix sp. FI2-JRJ7]